MKYGQTLKQRSIREWGHYNLDYDEIKYLIKEHTTPGKGKAVSIPGQDNVTSRDFAQLLFELLRDQHLRIELFVKSKSNEIEKRLDHLARQIRLFRLRFNPDTSTALPVRQLEKFARIETDILRAGQDIRSLSRFVGAQRLGFTKLLKKYRKWTGLLSLGDRFHAEILDQSIPLSRHNLDSLLDHWAEVLHSFRTVYETVQAKRSPFRTQLRNMSVSGDRALDSQASSTVLHHMHNASTSLSNVDFDTSFTTLPIGDAGTKATYWIHPDQVIEVTVMLMQYLRSRTEANRPSTVGNTNDPSRRSSVSRTPISRQGSIANSMFQPDLELDTGLLVLDDVDDFAQRQSVGTLSQIQNAGSESKAPKGRVRWTTNSEAVVVLKPLQDQHSRSCGYQAARVKRKHLQNFLVPENPFSSRRSSTTTDEEDNVATEQRRPEIVRASRDWLEGHDNIKPLTTICSKRTRFQGLTNDLTRGQWAVLDQNIYTSQALLKDIGENDWASFYRHSGTRFPYVVLQVRQEGPLPVDLIDLLDRSYLTERVRGFTMEAHAVWSCCKPSSMPPPSWLPLLRRDIRKLPNKEPMQRHHSIVQFSQTDDATIISDSATSLTAGELSSSLSGTAKPASSAPSLPSPSEAEETPTRSRAQRKPKRAKLQIPSEVPKEQAQPTRYWNEYDHPSDGEEGDAYVIYIDPNAPLGYPGQAAVEKVISWMTAPFKPANDEERRMLLSASSVEISPPDSISGEDESSSDETEMHSKPRSYGTLPAPVTASSQEKPTSWLQRLNPFSTTKPTTTNRRRSTTARRLSRPADPFTAELEQQFLAAESSKMRHCLTSLAAAVALLVVSFVLAATGRRKQRGTVDEGVLFGIVVSMLFAFAGVAYLWNLSWRDFYGEKRGLAHKWLLRGVVACVFVGVCVADGALVAWMIA